jgi:hypothetical protein
MLFILGESDSSQFKLVALFLLSSKNAGKMHFVCIQTTKAFLTFFTAAR